MSMTMCCSSGVVAPRMAVRASGGVRASSAARFPGSAASLARGRVSLGAPARAGRRGVVCMSAATDEIVEKLKGLTLLEASELVKQIEETFGVDASASAAVAVAAAPGAAAGGGEVAEAQTAWDVVLTAVDDSKRIGAIKAIRGVTSLGLKEAKDALDKLPFTVLEQANKEDCDKAKAALEEAGGKVEIK